MSNEDTKNLISRERPRNSYSDFYCFNFDPQFDAEYEPDNWRKAVATENFRAGPSFRAEQDQAKQPCWSRAVPEDYVIHTITPAKFTYQRGWNRFY